MTKTLFEEFKKVSSKEWKQKIQVDLKGADYNETLIYNSHEGIDIKPFYHSEDVKNQHTVHHPSSWNILEIINVSETEKGNKEAITAIKKGNECILFLITNEEINPDQLLQGIPKNIPIYIETTFLSQSYFKKIHKVASTSDNQIYLLTDIIGNLSKTGNWFYNLNKDHEILETLVKENVHLKNLISVDIGLLQNAGATMVQQLAYGLAHGNEYLNHLKNVKKNSFEENSIIFKVSVGSNYFFEIAKIRALRILWEILSSEYNMLKKCYIFAQPTFRNKTILDYNVNMLRTTTECMSAILGGADHISNSRYDAVYDLDTDFGNRIATNQLLILKNESYFDMVSNAAEGSFYIESLTNQLVEKSLELFKNIEKGGGYLKHLKAGIIQRKIKESANKEQELFDQEEIILTGANVFRNENEVFPEIRKSPFVHKKVRKVLLEPIVYCRLSEKIEKKLVKDTEIPL